MVLPLCPDSKLARSVGRCEGAEKAGTVMPVLLDLWLPLCVDWLDLWLPLCVGCEGGGAEKDGAVVMLPEVWLPLWLLPLLLLPLCAGCDGGAV